MQRSGHASYVCWACLSRGLRPKPFLVARPLSATASCGLSALRATKTARNFASVHEPLAQPSDDKDATRTPIRQHLQQWGAEYLVEAPKSMRLDDGAVGRAQNSLTRPRIADDSALERTTVESVADQYFSDRDGSLDLLPPPSNYLSGDLVQYTEDGNGGLAVLAICLGYSNGCYHFYSSGGRWYPMTDLKSHFVYRNFATEAEIQPVVNKLPQSDLSVKTLREMSALDMGPDRHVGASLLRRMIMFQQDTDKMLQKYATRFEKAHTIVTEGDQRYFTLEELRQLLLSKDDVGHPAPPHVLYAIHRTVNSDDVGFCVVGALGDSTNWLYEANTRENVSLIQNMQTLVRLFTDIPGRVGASLSSLTNSQLAESQLGQFILKAREAIDISRKFRDWTPHGILGPAKQRITKSRPAWTGVDMSIMHFMLLWSGYNQFSLSSRFHWIGSAILRATGMYKDSEYVSTTTAWTFLQEVGYLTPWDMHERYTNRVPGVELSRERGFVPFQLGPKGIRSYLTQDVFDGKRHDWASMKAFAIDSEDTEDVDDAVSVEATEIPGQHWVHIHVADPASRVRHHNALGERASLTPLTLYLSGHYSNIWGVKDELQKIFSLAPNRACLTFSGLVSDDGDLLQYKITPGRLREFVYMTPEDANTAAGVDSPQKMSQSMRPARFSVGPAPATKAPNRNMHTASELQPMDLESLKTLYRLADARKKKRYVNGATPGWAAYPSAKASFDHTSIERTTSGTMTCNGDPTIEISWRNSESPMVTDIMVLAGEIAARWSAERNIPMPYLSQSNAERNFDLLKAYTEKVYYPATKSGGQPSPEQFTQLRTLLGQDKLSTQPARHFLMGVEMYTKVTSPLRRYSDLLAHWQIENALLQELETGEIAEAKLPFQRHDLEQNILPWLSLRQQIIRRLGNVTGNKAYMLQALVRAWKYTSVAKGESDASNTLPDTFRLTITEKSGRSAVARTPVLLGSLDWFGLRASMGPQGLGSLGLSLAEVSVGDVFEVKLLDVNVHMSEVTVQVVEKVSVQKDDEVEQVGDLAEDA